MRLLNEPVAPTLIRDAEAHRIPPLGWVGTLLVFGGAAVLLLVSTRLFIPAFSEAAGIEPVLAWFVIGGALVFGPIVLAAYWLVRREPTDGDGATWAARLRFRRMDGTDWLWAAGALLAVGLLTAAAQATVSAVEGGAALHPPFMAFEPLSAGRYWILAAWAPFWVLNILGEEFAWRGVILPRQEVALGSHAWIANSLGWLLFHLAFGWRLLLILLPITFILPFVAQRRKNTWVAVVVHAGLNGPAFVAVALGLV